MSEVVYIISNYSKIIYKSDKRMFNVIYVSLILIIFLKDNSSNSISILLEFSF